MWLHDAAIREFGGADGIRDSGMLESALARPVAGSGGTALFPRPFDRAAALMEAVIRDHGFLDGNKRTAVMAAGLSLEREGSRLEAAPGELVDLALSVAEHSRDVEDIAGWLEARCTAIERGTSERDRPGPGPERSGAVRAVDLGLSRER